MENKDTNIFIQKIKEEQQKIDKRWLQLHHKTVVYSALAGLLIEGVFATALYYSDRNIGLGPGEYFTRYILLPVLLNTGWILFSIWATHTPRLSSSARAYMNSIALVGICFVFYSAHYNYELNIVFCAPVLLTVIYGNYRMAAVIAALSISAKIISDLFISWNVDKIYPFRDSSTIVGFIVKTLILVLFYAMNVAVIYFQREKNNVVIQKEIEQYEMHQQLVIDSLTKIPNRIALRDAFSKMEADTSGVPYYFVMADLDNFKRLNDTLGHEKGDQCLEEVGEILKAFCLDEAIPFRLGGDEFCILFRDRTIGEVLLISQKIQDKIREKMRNMFDIPVTICIGIARYSKEMTTSQLLQKADIALYRSKEKKDTISISEEIV